MIEYILDMLEIAKKEKQIGEYTYIALGKNHLPTTIKEGYKQVKIKHMSVKKTIEIEAIAKDAVKKKIEELTGK